MLIVGFSFIYLLILVGNFEMVMLIKTESQLHAPMYFLLSNLPILDVSYSAVIAPRMLLTFAAKRNATGKGM